MFACYEFLHEMGVKPKDYLELFEFIKYTRVKNVLKDMIIAAAKTGLEDG